MKLNYFNFKQFDKDILLTNDFGCHAFVSPSEFNDLIEKKIDLESDLGKKLLEKKFIYDETNLEYSTFHKYDMRHIKSHVNIATSLHIFVVTTACNMNCVYCQANNGKKNSTLFMTKEMAEKAVNIALSSPAESLSFEFQGGEPLLNFDVIKHIVSYTESVKGCKNVSYNVVTNLTLLTDEIIDFFCQHNFGVSTSIDGSKHIHNQNRPFLNGGSTFDIVAESVQRLRSRGLRVGAIQTTTREALQYPRELVQTYDDLGFDNIFIRPLTPLGKASLRWDEIGYSPEEFVAFYTAALKELISINKSGKFLKEDHASILLSRIQGRFVNYMELRSPCGAGIGQLAYYADGNIYTCDEGRMLSEMGDATFCLGNVFTNTYENIINNGVCKTVCASSILETIPTCCDCVYQPYCGTCPVVNYAKHNDIIEKEPRGYRCKIYSGMLDFLFSVLRSKDEETIAIFNTWSN